MSSRTRYITHVSHTLGGHWQWTKPCYSPELSIKAAENMVCSRIMDDRGISRDLPGNFGLSLRKIYPDIVEESRQFIGETRMVVLLENETPKEFQKRFHEVQYSPDSGDNGEEKEIDEVD